MVKYAHPSPMSIVGPESSVCGPRPPAAALVVVVRGHNRDHARHGGAEVAVGILDASVRSGSDRLAVCVEMRVEPAVVDEGSGVIETHRECSGLAVIGIGARNEV